MPARFRPWLLISLALLSGFALRWWFIQSFAQVAGDSLTYGDLGKNLLLHHTFGYSTQGAPRPTLIRLPGYPLFLAACFGLFGVEHYTAVMRVQLFIDLASCLLIALAVGRAIPASLSRRVPVATIALSLASLCPFTANYVAAPMSETLSIFTVALGFAALTSIFRNPHSWISMLLLACACSYATLLRPDGALLGVVLFPAMFLLLRHTRGSATAFFLTAVAALIALVPFALWTARNERVFHVFQPLAPRYATEVNEFVPRGFNRWMATWAVDFASTSEIYWAVNDGKLDDSLLPDRAFDSPQQRDETEALIADYNQETTLTEPLDVRFGQLAAQRTHQHPLRTYVLLPLARLANMWLRPRVEMLQDEVRWWNFRENRLGAVFAVVYAVLNAAYLALALSGLLLCLRRPALWAGSARWLLWPLAFFVLLRCALLLTLETSEPRYTLECYPAVFCFAAVAFAHRHRPLGADVSAAPHVQLSSP